MIALGIALLLPSAALAGSRIPEELHGRYLPETVLLGLAGEVAPHRTGSLRCDVSLQGMSISTHGGSQEYELEAAQQTDDGVVVSFMDPYADIAMWRFHPSEAGVRAEFKRQTWVRPVDVAPALASWSDEALFTAAVISRTYSEGATPWSGRVLADASGAPVEPMRLLVGLPDAPVQISGGFGATDQVITDEGTYALQRVPGGMVWVDSAGGPPISRGEVDGALWTARRDLVLTTSPPTDSAAVGPVAKGTSVRTLASTAEGACLLAAGRLFGWAACDGLEALSVVEPAPKPEPAPPPAPKRPLRRASDLGVTIPTLQKKAKPRDERCGCGTPVSAGWALLFPVLLGLRRRR